MNELTDEKLFFLCRKYGEITLQYRNKFIGLLPEVFRRHLYKKKGFDSIYEFAAKLAGIGERQVDIVLNLRTKFNLMPTLLTMLEQGQVSINKLARIVSVATPETQEFWATQTRILSNRALEILVRDTKMSDEMTSEKPVGSDKVDGLPLPNKLFNEDVMHVHHEENKINILQPCRGVVSEPDNRQQLFSKEIENRLIELQNKGIDINLLLKEFLDERELKIAREKERLSVEAKETDSRYISAATKKLLKQEYGEKCSIKTCQKPADIIHHAQRFSLAKIHDPKYLAPLCKYHHKIAHSIDVKFYEKRDGHRYL